MMTDTESLASSLIPYAYRFLSLVFDLGQKQLVLRTIAWPTPWMLVRLWRRSAGRDAGPMSRDSDICSSPNKDDDGDVLPLCRCLIRVLSGHLSPCIAAASSNSTLASVDNLYKTHQRWASQSRLGLKLRFEHIWRFGCKKILIVAT